MRNQEGQDEIAFLFMNFLDRPNEAIYHLAGQYPFSKIVVSFVRHQAAYKTRPDPTMLTLSVMSGNTKGGQGRPCLPYTILVTIHVEFHPPIK